MDYQGNKALFPSFNRLPPNLRMMIWEESIEPRLVSANLVCQFAARTRNPIISWRVTRIPALFETSVEARRAALSQYKILLCVAPVKMGGGRSPPAAMVYFHPQMDVLGQDFDVMMLGLYLSIVRCPGISQSFPYWPLSFFDIFSGERLINGSFDPLHDLRHIHLNIIKARADIRGSTDPASRTPTWFIMGLLYRQPPLRLNTVTVQITMDPQTCPPTSASPSDPQASVYRVVRRPTLPLPKPSKFLSGISSEKHLAMLEMKQYQHPSYIDILADDGAVFTRPIPSDFAVLRVIDPASDGVGEDATARESRYRSIVQRGINMTVNRQLPSVGTWVAEQLLGNSMPPFPDTPWGICGVNYGMGETKIY